MSGLEVAIPAIMSAAGGAGSAIGSGLGAAGSALGSAGSAIGSGLSGLMGPGGLGSSAMGLGSSLLKPIMGLFGGGGDGGGGSPGGQLAQGAGLSGLGQALGAPQSGVSIAPGAMQQMGQNVGMNPASIASAIPAMAGGVPQFSYDPSGTGITGAPAVSPGDAGQAGLAQSQLQQMGQGNPAMSATSDMLSKIIQSRQRRPPPGGAGVSMSPPSAQPVGLGNQPGQMSAGPSPMERYAMLLRGMR